MCRNEDGDKLAAAFGYFRQHSITLNIEPNYSPANDLVGLWRVTFRMQDGRKLAAIEQALTKAMAEAVRFHKDTLNNV